MGDGVSEKDSLRRGRSRSQSFEGKSRSRSASVEADFDPLKTELTRDEFVAYVENPRKQPARGISYTEALAAPPEVATPVREALDKARHKHRFDDPKKRVFSQASAQKLNELANIDAHGRAIFPNCLPAIALDLREPWPAAVADASLSLVICANTLHITPWACSEGLFEHAARALKPGGHLCAYGPFKVDGAFVGDDGGAGNERFDAKLRSTNGAWGLRDVGDLAALAAQRGLRLAAKIPMPANNLTLHFIKN